MFVEQPLASPGSVKKNVFIYSSSRTKKKKICCDVISEWEVIAVRSLFCSFSFCCNLPDPLTEYPPSLLITWETSIVYDLRLEWAIFTQSSAQSELYTCWHKMSHLCKFKMSPRRWGRGLDITVPVHSCVRALLVRDIQLRRSCSRDGETIQV